jgi:hypothetical protein
VTIPVKVPVVKLPEAGVVPPIVPGSAKRAVRFPGVHTTASEVPVTLSASVANSTTPVAEVVAACFISPKVSEGVLCS